MCVKINKSKNLVQMTQKNVLGLGLGMVGAGWDAFCCILCTGAWYSLLCFESVLSISIRVIVIMK